MNLTLDSGWFLDYQKGTNPTRAGYPSMYFDTVMSLFYLTFFQGIPGFHGLTKEDL